LIAFAFPSDAKFTGPALVTHGPTSPTSILASLPPSFSFGPNNSLTTTGALSPLGGSSGSTPRRKVPLFEMDDDEDDRIRIHNNIAVDGKFDVDSYFVKGVESKRKKLCRKGIPPSYRTQMWPKLVSYKCDKALIKPTGTYCDIPTNYGIHIVSRDTILL
jgi:hypothetical protein